MGPTKRERERVEARAREQVRGRIVIGLHSGQLNPGDRLASYREVAEETGLDLRGVMRVYRALEEEGLVEVRGRSGVFVAQQEKIGGRVLAETARWTVTVLREAWRRRIAIPELPEFVRRCTAAAVVRCACVESTRDQLDTLCTELKEDFGFASSAVHAQRLGPILAGAEPPERAPPELREADFIVTTTFHAAALRPLAASLGKPLVTVRLNPDIVREVERRLEEGELTVVCVDPDFLRRLRLVIGEPHAGRIRGVLAGDVHALRRLERGRPVLISRAARTLLPDLDLPRLYPEVPAISPESAEELAELLVRFNLEALREAAK